MNSSAPPPLPLTAVLLAGGRSERMGRDKALVEFEGQPLWRRQLATLKALCASELIISGPRRSDFPQLRTLEDVTPGRGPLSGIASALQAAHLPLLLVLAVDLPHMTPQFLQHLCGLACADCGVVPYLDDRANQRRRYEPLAAIYPVKALAIANECLAGADWSLHHFVRRLLSAGLVAEHEIDRESRGLFRNVNSPGDLAVGDSEA